MNNTYSILPGEDEFEAIINHLRFMFHQAQKRDERFDKENYKWRIGMDIYVALELNAASLFNPTLVHHNNDVTRLFGIPVEKDTVNLRIIELWQNITNEV